MQRKVAVCLSGAIFIHYVLYFTSILSIISQQVTFQIQGFIHDYDIS